MKREKISDSIHNIDPRYLQEAADYMAEVKSVKTRRPTRWIAAAACLCLVALAGVGAWQGGLFDNDPAGLLENPVSSGGQGSTIQTASGDSVQTESDILLQGDDIASGAEVEVMGYAEWNGLLCSLSLHHALTESQSKDTVYLIAVTNHSREALEQFVYQGKTYAELEAEYKSLRTLIGKMGVLRKEGDELRYGETLYTTGAPGGCKWAKALYEERMAYYGEAFLAQYIVDGVFLSEKLEQDVAEVKADLLAIEAKRNDALAAYAPYSAENTRKEFAARGISATVENNSCRISVTAEELAAFAINYCPQDYLFFLAADQNDDAEDFVSFDGVVTEAQ